MKSVARILKAKADQTIYTIAPTASVFDAVKLMAEKNIGALGSNGGREDRRHHYRTRLCAKDCSHGTVVKGYARARYYDRVGMYVSPLHRSEECMALMTENRVRHLLVIDNGKLIGLLSIGDLVKDTISEQKFIIQQLEHYITGEPIERLRRAGSGSFQDAIALLASSSESTAT